MKKILAGLTVLTLVGGCGTPNSSGGATTGGIELVAANVAHVTGSAEDAAAAGSAINDFGMALYRRVATDAPATNLVVSPASIALALSMARAGARGQTAAEMDAVMRDLGADQHATWVAALDSLLNARTGSFPDESGQAQDVTLRIVNAPFAQRGFALETPYVQALGERFGAGLRLVDYVTAAEAARAAINDWVAGQTEQRIKDLLAQGDVDEMTRLVLVNAIYLKAAWQTPFGEGATAPALFTRLDGTTVDAPLMHASGQLPYAAGLGWQVVELPYVGGKLSMLVIVPDDLAAFEKTLDGAALAGIVGDLSSREVILALPKFGTESKLELAPVLAALGMPTAFTDAADFSGITKEQALQVSAVIHQANIDVDEKGTEAAAATAVVMRATAMPAEPVTLTVDRPFLFALRDVESGAVLFLGRIADPTVR
jgi:serpin B